MEKKKYFPCGVCKGKGTWIEVVIEETGQGPLESCFYCDGEGVIEINGPIHKRIRAEKIAMEILKYDTREFSYEEIIEIGNKALALV